MLRALLHRGGYTRTRSYHTKQCFGHRRRPSLESSHGELEQGACDDPASACDPVQCCIKLSLLHISVGLPSSESLKSRVAEGNLWRLATAYQSLGHSVASLDPLGLTTPTCPTSLLPESYGLDPQDSVHTQDILFSFPASTATVTEAVDYLRDMYSGSMSLDASAMTVSPCYYVTFFV